MTCVKENPQRSGEEKIIEPVERCRRNGVLAQVPAGPRAAYCFTVCRRTSRACRCDEAQHRPWPGCPFFGVWIRGVNRADWAGITTRVAPGTQTLYAQAASENRFVFISVTHAHDARLRAFLERFKVISSFIAVALSGRANAQWLGGRQMSVIGGLADFLRGVASSEDGLAVLASPSTRAGGRISRIVPCMETATVKIARTDMRYAVTEHCAVDFLGLDMDSRALETISIADPAHQPNLHESWKSTRERL